MGGLGFSELVIILVIALLVFGAGKLPQVGSSLGKAIRDFRRATSGEDEEHVAQATRANEPREALPPTEAHARDQAAPARDDAGVGHS